MPDEIVERLQKSRKANAGGFNLRQIILGTFDQTIHTRGEADTKSLFAQTYRDIMDIEPIPNTNMPANFGHLAGGYDAQYYGYLVRDVSVNLVNLKQCYVNFSIGLEFIEKYKCK